MAEKAKEPDKSQDDKTAAKELEEFRKILDASERKKFWLAHKSVQAVYAESNFH